MQRTIDGLSLIGFWVAIGAIVLGMLYTAANGAPPHQDLANPFAATIIGNLSPVRS